MNFISLMSKTGKNLQVLTLKMLMQRPSILNKIFSVELEDFDISWQPTTLKWHTFNTWAWMNKLFICLMQHKNCFTHAKDWYWCVNWDKSLAFQFQLLGKGIKLLQHQQNVLHWNLNHLNYKVKHLQMFDKYYIHTSIPEYNGLNQLG